MNHYVNINAKQHKKLPPEVNVADYYEKLHQFLVINKDCNIAVAFPEYCSTTIGATLQLQGSKCDLEKILLYFRSTGIKHGNIESIPKDSHFATLRRVQTNMSNAKLRRLQKRHSISNEEINAYKIKMLSESLDYPFLNIKSHSTKKLVKRFFKLEASDKPCAGEFDTFGVSKVATIAVVKC